VLLYHGNLSQNARDRLAVMRATNDGFVIAQKDLELRGAGEVLGTRQTGEMQLRIADIFKHQHLLTIVNRWTDAVLAHHPEQAQQLIDRWVGDDEQFANV
jgi:ATP-dependent DNA helicase RecG